MYGHKQRKVHYRVHKSLLLFQILGQINSVPPSYQVSPPKLCTHLSSPSFVPYAPSICLITLTVQTITLLTMQSPSSLSFATSAVQISPSAYVLTVKSHAKFHISLLSLPYLMSKTMLSRRSKHSVQVSHHCMSSGRAALLGGDVTTTPPPPPAHVKQTQKQTQNMEDHLKDPFGQYLGVRLVQQTLHLDRTPCCYVGLPWHATSHNVTLLSEALPAVLLTVQFECYAPWRRIDL
jgi:hypothetical protein